MKDSYKNWFQVRYQYDEATTFEEAQQKQREVDLKVLEWGMGLPEEELWHVRFGLENNIGDFAIRVKPFNGKMEERKEQAMKLGEMIPATPIMDNYKWWTSDNELPSNCKTIAEWFSMALILCRLSKIVYELIKMDVDREEYFLYRVVIHHLHNMMHIQDEHYPAPYEHNLSTRALFMTGRLITFNNSVMQWIPIVKEEG